MTARDALMSLVDSSNWPEEAQAGDYFRGYRDAMEEIQQVLADFWDELGKKELAP